VPDRRELVEHDDVGVAAVEPRVDRADPRRGGEDGLDSGADDGLAIDNGNANHAPKDAAGGRSPRPCLPASRCGAIPRTFVTQGNRHVTPRLPVDYLDIASFRPPLIGIVTHELREDPAPAWAPADGRGARDLAPARLHLRLTYLQAIQEAGGIAVVMPAHGFVDDAHALLDRVDGLLFSGGPDLDPSTYGRRAHPELGPNVEKTADEYELAMHKAARERDLPVLGICRGLQSLNVARRGTLHQHLPDRTELDHRPDRPPHAAAHVVTVEAGSSLHRVTGHRRLNVNSVHHQAIDDLGEGLEIIARAPDGTIEAIQDPNARFCLAVQWHAEMLTHREEHAPVIQALIEAAGRPALRLAA
jgi:putative glutamine amidotransferase